MGKATQDLRNEHNAILHVLKIMDKMIAADNRRENTVKIRYGNELIRFLRVFADKCHHGKEENYLFMEMVSAGVPDKRGPIGAMLQEHKLGRGYIGSMVSSLETKDLANFNVAAAEYVDLLRNHIKKENEVLFVIADRVLNDIRQDELFRKFQQHEENVIGHGVHEELHAMIQQWSDEFGVHE